MRILHKDRQLISIYVLKCCDVFSMLSTEMAAEVGIWCVQYSHDNAFSQLCAEMFSQTQCLANKKASLLRSYNLEKHNSEDFIMWKQLNTMQRSSGW